MQLGRLRPWLTAALLFAIAYVIRLAFVHATIDSIWPYSACFKGDSILYVQQAHVLLNQEATGGSLRFEHGLPLRPPGMGYLVAWLWDGQPTAENFAALRGYWLSMGALVAPLLYLTSRSALTERVAILAAGFTAIATGPLLLNASLSSETPYLVLAVATVGWLGQLRKRWHLALWSAVCGSACLFRTEHALFFVFGLGWFLWRQDKRLVAALLALAAFALPTVPWHRTAWAAIADLNENVRIQPRYTMGWTAEAKATVDRMPAFARGSTVAMIQDAVRLRGGERVTQDDLGILEEAFDYTPARLNAHPFISSYGPLNFYLANDPASRGGFSRAALFTPPPLHGGAERFPPGLTANLERLSLSYPPHIRVLNDGYSLRLAAIASDPLAWLGLVAEKLVRAWAGAAHGLGGYALPMGLSGTRHRVDILVPGGAVAIAWKGLLLLATLAGIWIGWRRRGVEPWLLWLAARVVVVVLFFGYARQGALMAPALGVLFALLLDRVWSRVTAGVCIAVLASVLVAEGVRFWQAPGLTIDDTKILGRDPFDQGHEDRRIEVR